jgi:hypothetical protein
MGCGSLSPAAATAMSGMLQGKGLEIPAKLTTAVTNYTAAGTVATAQSTMSAASGVLGNPLAGLGSKVFPALTGVVPEQVAPMMASNNLNNYAGQITKQANQIMSGGIGGFSQIFAQAQSFATNSLSAKSFASSANNIPIPKLGLNISNMSDLASNGFGKISGDMTKFASVVGKLGGLYDTRNIAGFGTPGNMMKNLLNKNLGSVGDLVGKLEDRRIPLNDLENPKYEAKIRQALSEVDPTDVRKIYGTLNVNLPNSTNLTDALDINKLDSAANVNSISSDVRSLTALGKRFSDMGASFDSATDLAKLASSIELVSVPRLDSHTGDKLVASADRQVIDNQLGYGSGPANNPNIDDIIGSVAGLTHTSSLESMVAPLATIKASSNGILLDKQLALMRDVANGVYDGGGNAMLDVADPARYGNIVVIPGPVLSDAGMNSLVIDGNITKTLTDMRVVAETTMTTIKNDPALYKEVNLLTYHYQQSAEQLACEKYNLAAAGIDLSLPVGSSGSSISTDNSYPNAPLTNWSADDLFRYWKTLPPVNTGQVTEMPMSTALIEKQDLCRGAMYLSSAQFTNGAAFSSQITGWFDSGADPFYPKANLGNWSRSLYPLVGNVSFDFATGICHFSEKQWRADGLTDDRPLGYPITGIPNGAVASTTPTLNPDPKQPPGASGGGDKNSIINFASQLGDIGKDTNGLGLSRLISNMASNDVYGDAIKVAMIEGRNQARLQSVGITPIANKIGAAE